MTDAHIEAIERIANNLLATSIQIEKINLDLLTEKFVREELEKKKPKNYKEEKELIDRVFSYMKEQDYKYFKENDVLAQIRYEVMRKSWAPLYS